MSDQYWTATAHAVPVREFVKYRRALLLTLTSLLVLGIYGCTNTFLAAARNRIAAGDYAGAHQALLQAKASLGSLSAGERREVLDDLCLSELRIGAGSYPLLALYQACAEAAREPGSVSNALVARIQEQARAEAAAKVSASLAVEDFVEAQDVVVRYREFPGTDRRAIAVWSRQIWDTINRGEAALRIRQSRETGAAVTRISRDYPHLGAMNQSAFRQWIVATMTVDGVQLVSGVQMSKGALKLWIPERAFHTATLNLGRFARVNDGLVAHCRCDGRTHVALQDSGMPAYLVRLDPETRRSEVLILPQQ